MSIVERAKVVKEARSWIGTPYHPHARLKGIGVDCAMLPAEVYEACGMIEHVDYGKYPINWHLHRSEERYLEVVLSHAKETDQPKMGDFILFKWGRCFAHGGIITQWPLMIHALNGVGVIEQDATKERFTGREFRTYTLWED